MTREFFFLKKPVHGFLDILVENQITEAAKSNLVFFYRETENSDEPKIGHLDGLTKPPIEAIEAVELEENTQEAVEALLRLYPWLYCYGIAKIDGKYRLQRFSIIDDVTLEYFLRQAAKVVYTEYELKCFEYFWENHSEDYEHINKEQFKEAYLIAQRMLRNKMLFKAQEFLTRPQTHPTKAVLEALQYGGLSIPETHTFEAMQEDSRKQFEEAFPRLAKKD